MESGLPQASAIPVATISGQQGHPSSLHHIMATNVQMSIIRSSAPRPPMHIGASHLPRGAAAAAVMSSSKVTTVLRPASAQLTSAAAAQSAAQHIIHPPIQASHFPTPTRAHTGQSGFGGKSIRFKKKKKKKKSIDILNRDYSYCYSFLLLSLCILPVSFIPC
ncbi:hypothetical protein FKM82_026863 [Ascaphus truei]